MSKAPQFLSHLYKDFIFVTKIAKATKNNKKQANPISKPTSLTS